VVLETTDQHTLVLTSRLVGNTSIQQTYSLGIRPERFQVVAAEIVLVDTPGVTTANLRRFECRRRRRPLYPFEPDAAY
jgi:microcystin degradation protein MlrC